MCIYIYVQTCVYIRTYACSCISVYIHIIYVYIYIYNMHTYVYICASKNKYILKYICLYICIYIHIEYVYFVCLHFVDRWKQWKDSTAAVKEKCRLTKTSEQSCKTGCLNYSIYLPPMPSCCILLCTFAGAAAAAGA